MYSSRFPSPHGSEGTWRGHSCLQRRDSSRRVPFAGKTCWHQCQHGTHECVRHSAFVISFLAACLSFTACRREPTATQATAPPPATVQTAACEMTDWPSGRDATGTVRARTSAVLSSRLMGYVREVRVHPGDHVAAGQVVAVIDSRDLDVAYRQAQAARDESHDAEAEVSNAAAAAKANLDLAHATFRRMQDLFERRSISNQEYDEAAARLKTAQASYDMAVSKKTQFGSRIRGAEEGVHAAEVMRGYAEVRSPFAGTVTERRADPGILATPGLPLVTVEQSGGYRLEVSAEESLAPYVRLGQAVQVTIDSLDRAFDARVSEIVPAVDPGSRGFIVKIDLPTMKDLRSGLYGRARFVAGSRQTLTIPAEAVRRNGQIESVMVAENGIARMRLVTTGETQSGRLEVLSGLRAGETVIRDGSVADGARVEAR
jgi:RND family efflux transporter MFP subunit